MGHKFLPSTTDLALSDSDSIAFHQSDKARWLVMLSIWQVVTQIQLARTDFNLNPHHRYNLIRFMSDNELPLIPAEQSLEETKKLLLLLLGCAVQVSAGNVTICVQKMLGRI